MKDIKEIGPKGKKGTPWSFWFDITDALVNKPVDERDTGPVLWREYYGDQWPVNPPYPVNALKIYNLAGHWAFEAWDEAQGLPGEPLLDSLNKGRYNSWDNVGNYILDTMAEGTSSGTDANIAPPGTPKYRPKPDEPGYTGPYLTHV